MVAAKPTYELGHLRNNLHLPSLLKMNHYQFIEKHGEAFSVLVGLSYNIDGLAGSHGDKCYGYKRRWEEAGIPFNHGALIYLLSYCSPYDKESRQTENGWVPVEKWVIEFYSRPEITAFFESIE